MLLTRQSQPCCPRTQSPLHHLTPRQQVRSIAVGDIGIITGSRDTTIKIWADDTPDTCSLLNTLVGQCGGVTSGRLRAAAVQGVSACAPAALCDV